jgi:hypothetical protein
MIKKQRLLNGTRLFLKRENKAEMPEIGRVLPLFWDEALLMQESRAGVNVRAGGGGV